MHVHLRECRLRAPGQITRLEPRPPSAGRGGRPGKAQGNYDSRSFTACHGARVRSTSGDSEWLSLRRGTLCVDLLWQTVTVDCVVIELTPSRFRLLAYLVAAGSERPLPVREIAVRVFKRNDPGAENAVRVAVAELRRALGDAASMLETVRGVGYRLGSCLASDRQTCDEAGCRSDIWKS
jgi:DNA-binding response OmpR family regulator